MQVVNKPGRAKPSVKQKKEDTCAVEKVKQTAPPKDTIMCMVRAKVKKAKKVTKPVDRISIALLNSELT